MTDDDRAVPCAHQHKMKDEERKEATSKHLRVTEIKIDSENKRSRNKIKLI